MTETETILHEAFHAVLPLLASHVEVMLTGVTAAVLYWLRRQIQVSRVQQAADMVTVETAREAATGTVPTEDLQEWRTAKRAREHMHPLLRPREARLFKLVKAARKKPPRS